MAPYQTNYTKEKVPPMATFTRNRAVSPTTNHQQKMDEAGANIDASIDLIFAGDGGLSAAEQLARLQLLEKVAEAIAIGGLAALQQLISATKTADKPATTDTRRGREVVDKPVGDKPADSTTTTRTRRERGRRSTRSRA
jgi:hypothetical protein